MTGQDRVGAWRRPRTGQDKDKVGARRRPRTGQDKDKRVVGGGLRFFIGEQGNKQVAVNSIVLQYYRLYALLHAVPPPWGSHLSHPPDATTFP